MHIADPHSLPFSYTIDSSFDAVRDRVLLDAEENGAKFIGLALTQQTEPCLSWWKCDNFMYSADCETERENNRVVD